jgi:hypothetical protein
MVSGRERITHGGSAHGNGHHLGLKWRHYCREESEQISRQDVQLDALRARIQSYMACKGIPPEWAPDGDNVGRHA